WTAEIGLKWMVGELKGEMGLMCVFLMEGCDEEKEGSKGAEFVWEIGATGTVFSVKGVGKQEK
ncbi:hypothetical protein A2U01_0020179, partial [Trifolium medium]|nr:hypothetical protein [Trifolium medium]